MYTIKYHTIIFKFKDDINLSLLCTSGNNNIIDKYSFTENGNERYYNILKSNYSKIAQMYKQIIDYNYFENDIKQKIDNKNKDNHCFGIFVDRKWIQEWMEYSHFKNIYDLLSKTKDEKNLINLIIYYDEIEKKNNKKLSDIHIYDFKTKNKFESFFNNNSICLVNANFIENFCKKNSYISFTICGESIKFRLNNDNIIKNIENLIMFQINPINSNNKEQKMDISLNLKILIKLFYFKKELKNNIDSTYNKEKDKNKKEVYFIEKKFINKYKAFFRYDFLNGYLINEKSLSKIEYKDLDGYYTTINTFLESNQKEYLDLIKKKESSVNIDFLPNNYTPNIFQQEEKLLKYLYDYEIVDGNIISSFEKIGINIKKYLIKGIVIAGDKYIFISFIKENKYNFQIDSFDEVNNKFVNEYIIGDKYHLNEVIIDYFNQNGIIYFINKRKDNLLYYNSNNSNNPIGYLFYTKNSKGYKKPKNSILSMNENDSKKIMDIIHILLYYSLFDKQVRAKISESQSIISFNNKISQIGFYYLINKEIISEFLNYFWSDIIKEIISKKKNINSKNDIKNNIESIIKDETYINFINSISNKIDDFNNRIKDKDLFFIEQSKYNLLNYPKNFIFTDLNLLLLYINFFGIQNYLQKIDELKIKLTFNNGNIVFKGDALNFLNNNLYLTFIYKIDDKLNNMNYNLEAILQFNCLTEFENSFSIINKENILFNCNHYKENFEQKYNLKVYLIKQNIDNKIDSSLAKSRINNSNKYNSEQENKLSLSEKNLIEKELNYNNNQSFNSNKDSKKGGNYNKKSEKNINIEQDYINELKAQLDKANKIIEEQNKEIQNLKNQLNSYQNINLNQINELKNQIKNLKNKIKNKDNQIKSLHKKLLEINPQSIINDKCVNFISVDSKVHYAIPCSGDSTFAEIEEKLYLEYPEYRETNNTFLADGQAILRFKTINENNIGTGRPVTLVEPP